MMRFCYSGFNRLALRALAGVTEVLAASHPESPI
jgi:hypothetical protein